MKDFVPRFFLLDISENHFYSSPNSSITGVGGRKFTSTVHINKFLFFRKYFEQNLWISYAGVYQM